MSNSVDPDETANDSNTDGSFTVADSNSFLSPLEILHLSKKRKYVMIF